MVTSSFNGHVVHKRASACQELRRCKLHVLIPLNVLAASKPQCPAAVPANTLAHAAPFFGRPQSMRVLHPPGPLATHTGSAQVVGLLKERSQDYYVAAADVAFEGEYYCSQTSWTDDSCDGHAPAPFWASAGNGCGSAAGCSTSNSGTGFVSRTSATDVPSSIVVTGVFDGHGGEMSARYAQQAILSYVTTDQDLHISLGKCDVEATSDALRAIYRRVDSELLSKAAAAAASDPLPLLSPSSSSSFSCCSSSSCSSSSSSSTALQTDCNGVDSANGNRVNSANRVNGSGDFHDGTTALVTLQLGGLLAVANAGDSRAVLCRQGQAVRLSRDHTPALRTERERIEAAGGQVVMARGAARVLVPLAGRKDVMQALSVSRSLGDPDFKASGLLISDPDVEVVPLQPGVDLFLIAASDGLWGRVSDQEAVDCVSEVLSEYSRMSSASRAAAAKAAAKRLLRLALDQGSVDDVTVVVNVFAWSP